MASQGACNPKDPGCHATATRSSASVLEGMSLQLAGMSFLYLFRAYPVFGRFSQTFRLRDWFDVGEWLFIKRVRAIPSGSHS